MPDEPDGALFPPTWPHTPDVPSVVMLALIRQCIALAQAINAKADLLIALTQSVLGGTYSKADLAELGALDAKVKASTASLTAAVRAHQPPHKTEE